MRRACPVVLLAFFVLGVPLRSQADDHELTPRRGLPPKVVLRGCHTLTRFRVDFDGSGNLYEVEWRRCGPRNPDWKKQRFPQHYVVVRPPRGTPDVLGLTFTNSGSSDAYFLNDVKPVRIASGSQHALFVTSTTYGDGLGKMWCMLGMIGGQLQCWPQPEIDELAAQYLELAEKMCCRDWTLQLRGSEIHLEHAVARGGSPEGVIVIDLVPEESSLAVAGVRRVDANAMNKSAAKPQGKAER